MVTRSTARDGETFLNELRAAVTSRKTCYGGDGSWKIVTSPGPDPQIGDQSVQVTFLNDIHGDSWYTDEILFRRGDFVGLVITEVSRPNRRLNTPELAKKLAIRISLATPDSFR